MTNISTIPSIDEYLRERLMPVEGADSAHSRHRVVRKLDSRGHGRRRPV